MQAVKATNAILGMLNLQEEGATEAEVLARTKILCESCDGAVVLNSLDGLVCRFICDYN